MNLFDLPQGPLKEEFCEVIASGSGVRIERIVSTGQASPEDFFYDQAEDEWVAVLQGRAVVAFYSDTGSRTDFVLGPGDTLFIPAHVRHRVLETSTDPPCVWLCVFGCDMHTG